MSLDTALAAIRARAETLWPGLEATVPLAFPNDGFGPPIDSQGRPLPWVMIEVTWNPGASGFASIGAPGDNLARRAGHIWAYAFVGKGDGEARAHELIADAASIFEGQDFSGIVCQAMEPGGPVDSEDGNYFGQSASVPFDFDETA